MDKKTVAASARSRISRPGTARTFAAGGVYLCSRGWYRPRPRRREGTIAFRMSTSSTRTYHEGDEEERHH